MRSSPNRGGLTACSKPRIEKKKESSEQKEREKKREKKRERRRS
jgi:hypothetical protein